jgi:hypothetical protein
MVGRGDQTEVAKGETAGFLTEKIDKSFRLNYNYGFPVRFDKIFSVKHLWFENTRHSYDEENSLSHVSY